MKKLPLSGLIIISLVLLNSCFLLESNTRTISGTIYGGTTNLKIGAFPNSFNFSGGQYLQPDYVVTSESSSALVFHPLATATITGDTYTITLPENVEDMGDLVAWIEDGTSTENALDMNDNVYPTTGEFAYLPVKLIENVPYVVEITHAGSSYTYTYDHVSEGDTSEYLQAHNSDGFNFYVNGTSP